MEKAVVEMFIEKWRRYFGAAELPITFFYSDEHHGAIVEREGVGPHCIIARLIRVRRGESLSFCRESVNCFGGRRYLGFSPTVNKRFNYFISDGSDGGECERYKMNPLLVEAQMKEIPFLPAQGKNIVFKRWDQLEENDNPMGVIFFATPDVLSGLFTLARFDDNSEEMVMAPFGSGCCSIIYYPYADFLGGRQRAIIGLFDPSARRCVKENVMSFALPPALLLRMMKNMDHSFLTTHSWEVLQNRINK